MRVDVYLTENGYVKSRQRAHTLIQSGRVTVDGKTVTKPSMQISEGEHTVSVCDDVPYVGRGGLKLEGALDAFGIVTEGCVGLDVGASTGGFTDCLLSRGATKVYAIDAGRGQLAKKLLTDPRVVSIEGFNARNLSRSDVDGTSFDLVVMDVSFISATYLLPRFPEVMKENGHAVVLIKPQFEVGRNRIGKGGIVKDAHAHREAVERVLAAGRAVELMPVGLIASPVLGGDGNREFLVHFVYRSEREDQITDADIRRVTDT